MTQRKKWVVLVCLAIFWVGLIAVQRYRARVEPPVQRTSALHARIPQQQGRMSAPSSRPRDRAETPRLKLARIERVRPPYEPEARNIFAFIDPIPAVPSSPFAPSVLSAPSSPPPPPDPFVEEAKTLRLLGYVHAEGKAMVFLAYGNEVLVASESDVVAEKFRVKTVREDTVIVTSLDGSREIALGLSAPTGPPLPVPPPQKGKQP